MTKEQRIEAHESIESNVKLLYSHIIDLLKETDPYWVFVNLGVIKDELVEISSKNDSLMWEVKQSS